jgi:hypothetical protein
VPCSMSWLRLSSRHAGCHYLARHAKLDAGMKLLCEHICINRLLVDAKGRVNLAILGVMGTNLRLAVLAHAGTNLRSGVELPYSRNEGLDQPARLLGSTRIADTLSRYSAGARHRAAMTVVAAAIASSHVQASPPTMRSWNRSMTHSAPNVWMFTGSLIRTQREDLWKPGARNTMRVALTDLTEIGRRARLPARSRLAAIWLDPEPADDYLQAWYRNTGPITAAPH